MSEAEMQIEKARMEVRVNVGRDQQQLEQEIENKTRGETETHINATDNWSLFENAFSCC